MKVKFIKAFIKRLIVHNDFLPIKDAEGNLNLEESITVLTKDSFGSGIIMEILDGDKLTSEEITARLQENSRILTGIKAGAAYYFMEVFIFNTKPDQGKQEAMISCQFQKTMDKKYLKCMSIDLSSGTADKYFKAPVTDFGISKAAKSILEEGVSEEIDVAELNDIVIQKEMEYKIEFKVKVPVVTYALIAINSIIGALIYLYSLKSGVSYNELLLDFGAKENFNILAGEYWRFVTPVFLHTGMIHLLINCYSLYVIGVSVEKIFGRFRFLTVYFIAGVLGNLFSFVFSPNRSVGASGAIFGLLGALLYFGLERPVLFRKFFGNSILVTIFINLTYGFSNTGIDNFAHIGGLSGGFIASGIVAKPAKTRWYLNRTLYIMLTICIIISGLAYGFNNKQSKIIIKANELESLDRAQDWSKVESKAEELLDLNPGNTDIKTSVLWTLIKAEAMNQKYDEAVVHAKDMIRIDPQDGHYLLGVLYYDMQQFDLSKDELLEAKKAGAAYEQIDQILSDMEKLQNP